jgi:hypothetical protein
MQKAWKPARLVLVSLLSTLATSGLATVSAADAAQSVISKSTCPAPTLDHFTCDAQILVKKHGGKPVRPKVKKTRARHNVANTGLPAPQEMT